MFLFEKFAYDIGLTSIYTMKIRPISSEIRNSLSLSNWAISKARKMRVNPAASLIFIPPVLTARCIFRCGGFPSGYRCFVDNGSRTGGSRCICLPGGALEWPCRSLQGRRGGLFCNFRIPCCRLFRPRSSTCCNGAGWRGCQCHMGMACSICSRCKALSGISASVRLSPPEMPGHFQ